MKNILLVAEGNTDPPLVCGLTDRLLRDTVDWLRDQELDYHRRYRGLDEDELYFSWKEVRRRHAARFPRSRREWGRTGTPDERATYKLLRLVKDAIDAGKAIDAVIIFRDADKQSERRDGIRNALSGFLAGGGSGPWSEHMAIGVAIPKNEAWILAGFESRSDAERDSLAEIRRKLGFAPNLEPHRLTASDHDPSSKKSAKRVLDELCPDCHRRSACWEETPLDTLRARGEHCGLVEFLGEVRDHIVSLFATLPPDDRNR